MKKITLLLLTILPLLSFGQLGPNVAPNPILDGATDWSNLNAGTTQAYDAAFTRTADGSGSWLINSNGTFNSGIKSTNISGLAAGEYVFSYHVYGNAGDVTKPIIRDNGISSNVQGSIYTINADNTWELVEQTFVVSGSGTVNLRAMVNSDDDTMDFYVDDISFKYVLPTGNALNIDIVGAGTVTKSPDEISYGPTDDVTITATAAIHWNFDSWSGDITSTTNPEIVTMDTDKNITANFVLDPTFDFNFTFDTDGELEGWTEDPQLPVTAHTGGLLTFTTEADGWARFNLFDFPIPATVTDPTKYNKVTITLQNPSATTDQLGIIVSNGTETSTITFPMSTGDTALQTYDIDLTQFPAWSGDVTTFRIRFADADNPSLSAKPTEVHNIFIDDVTFSFDVALNNPDVQANNAITMYPNPVSNGVLNITGNSRVKLIEVYDITGKKVLQSNRLENNQLNIESINNGIYLVRLTTDTDRAIVKKLIIK